MLINLLEIPPEGKSFSFNQTNSELRESLVDLVKDQDFTTEFLLRPLQPGTFELKGKISTRLPEDCSRCGLDFQMDLTENFKELLIPQMNTPRNSKYAKANHVSDMHNDGPTVVEYSGHHFHMGEYLHEVIGLAEPFNPAPPCDKAGKCLVCHKSPDEIKTDYEDPGFEAPQSPFASLKGIKLN